mgnify:CR=1 FL=1
MTYISGRSASLMATFYLGGLYAYAAGSGPGRRWLLYGVSPALFCLAYFGIIGSWRMTFDRFLMPILPPSSDKTPRPTPFAK